MAELNRGLRAGLKNLDSTFFRFVTIHAFDRQTDIQLSPD